MTEKEIVTKLKNFVESSKNLGSGWTPDSSQYAGIVFKLFAEARELGYLDDGSPALTGDAMTDHLRGTLRADEDGWFQFYGEKWDRLCALWSHWRLYAKFDSMDPSEYV